MKRILPFVFVVGCGAWVYACSSDSGSGTDTNPPDGGGADSNVNNDGSDQDGGLDGTTNPDGPASNTNPIEGATAAEVLGAPLGFTDGPQWRGTSLYFSDYPNKVIVKLTPPNTTDPARNTVQSPLGTTFDTKNNTFVTVESEVSATPTSLLVRWDGGTSANVATTFDGGVPWESPNDVVVRASDGTMYVTDPGYQKEQGGGTLTANHLYRVLPNGIVLTEATYPNITRPNGIALSPTGTTLYVGFTVPDVGATNPIIMKYTVNSDGSLGASSKFVDVTPADSSPDGIAVDDNGNVFVAVKTGVQVYQPSGMSWGKIPVAKQPSNIGFGGADRMTLYITTETGVYSARVKVPGIQQ